MITAPLIAKDVLNLQLPKAQSGDGKVVGTLGIAVNRQGQILLNGAPVSNEVLAEEVKKAVQSDPEIQAIISGDHEVPYGAIVKAIDIIKTAGLSRFAVQIEHEVNPTEGQ